MISISAYYLLVENNINNGRGITTPRKRGRIRNVDQTRSALRIFDGDRHDSVANPNADFRTVQIGNEYRPLPDGPGSPPVVRPDPGFPSNGIFLYAASSL